jgi:signal transduction histidine kinase
VLPQLSVNSLSNKTLESPPPSVNLAGALAHELNNPLQGMFSVLSLLSRDYPEDQQVQVRLAQIRSGLARLSQVVDSFSTAYENQPRRPDQTTVGDFMDRLTTDLAARQLRADIVCSLPNETPIQCMAGELVRLLSDAYSLLPGTCRTLRVNVVREDDHVRITTVRDSSRGTEDRWLALNECGAVSGLAVLIHELARLSEGRAEFRFDDVALCGIRLLFISD